METINFELNTPDDYKPKPKLILPKFSEVISPLWNSFLEFNFTEEEITKAKNFSYRLIPEKDKEEGYRIDGEKKFKRNLTGRLGEMACEKYFGVEFCDWTIGKSKKFIEADLKKIGINAGIKTSDWYNFPMVPSNPEHPEVICLRQEYTSYICGWATVEDMKKYCNIELIKDEQCRAKGTKTAFYGFNFLKDLKDLK